MSAGTLYFIVGLVVGALAVALFFLATDADSNALSTFLTGRVASA